MMHVSTFRELYGEFGFVWGNIYRVELKDELIDEINYHRVKCFQMRITWNLYTVQLTRFAPDYKTL